MILQVLKLLKWASGIQVLLDTVIKALPQVGNLVCILFLKKHVVQRFLFAI